jgi:tight adherence protein B
MQDRKSTKGTLALIDRADLSFRAGEWLLIRIAAALVAAALMMLLAGGAQFLVFVALCAAAAAVGFLLPQLVLRFLAAHRAKKFERVLPDVLTLVATSLRSGFGLPQALDAVARDAAEPAAKEFSRALAETRIGTDVPDALDHMAERMDSTSLRWAVMAIRIQREVGGNLAELLTTVSATLRERERLRRQVKVLSAEGRLSAWILGLLPPVFSAYLLLTQPSYLKPLVTEPLGVLLLVMGVILLAVGTLWMRKAIKVEV